MGRLKSEVQHLRNVKVLHGNSIHTAYRAAQLRHMLNAAKSQIEGNGPSHLATDHETDLLELQHIATDALFQLELAMRERKGLPGLRRCRSGSG